MHPKLSHLPVGAASYALRSYSLQHRVQLPKQFNAVTVSSLPFRTPAQC